MPTPGQPFGQQELEELERLRREQKWQPDELRIGTDRPEMDEKPSNRGVEIIDNGKEDPRRRGEVQPTTLHFKK